jgi:aminopeptidase N
MNRFFACLLLWSFGQATFGQSEKDSLSYQPYRGTATKINDLVHTRLEARFDYQKRYMYGSVWITLKPHFYPTDSLLLDAKQMEISGVFLVQANQQLPLKYIYDGWHLNIKLNKTYKLTENYKIHILYTAKPEEAKVPQSERGLYFINPDGKEKNKPIQIWTDCETENASIWCPTIDKPNQKTTEEILLTVPSKYVTLSNGRLASQVQNKDGTRTDDWKMELPHAPYLFFMGVGDFTIVKDFYKGKEVSYYVEPEYASTARAVFGETPAMIAFFETITGVPYPWVKYSQIALRDFTSTAMENTTATAHLSEAQQDARELVDGNRWENNIAHELFHHWFGDYVTCESWSNLTLNESFARYSEYLWQQYRHGSDAAGAELNNQLRSYLGNPDNEAKALVRYHYADQEDMFDDVSYSKGSLILHMLRNYLGDSAFFKGLQLYLTRYSFQSAEAHQLRLVMEEVSGKDLNWFFNQWYFGNGHPKVSIDYGYDEGTKKVSVYITQSQGAGHLFRIPMTIDVYDGASKTSHRVWMTKEKDSFSFSAGSRPELVNVDAEKYILWEKKDNKTLANFIYQYDHAGNYLDRFEAIAACLREAGNPGAIEVLKKGLVDPYEGIRESTLLGLNIKNDTLRAAVEPFLVEMVKNDKKALARRYAIRQLASFPGKKYESLFLLALDDSSYSVAGEALYAINRMDSVEALSQAKRLIKEKTGGTLAEEIVRTLADFGSVDDFNEIANRFAGLTFKPRIARSFVHYLARIQRSADLERGVDIIVHFRETIPSVYTGFINKEILGWLLAKKEESGQKEQADYIKIKLPKTP